MSRTLIERLESNDPAERRNACLAAPREDRPAELLEALSAALGDPVKVVGRAASDALVQIVTAAGGTPEARDPVEHALHDALQSRNPARRWRAAFTVARIEPPSPRLLPALVDGLASTDSDVRWASAKVIVETGRHHAEVLPILVGLVRSGESATLRRMATFALRELAPDRSEAAGVLLEATRDADLQVKRAALTAMASLHEPPREVTIALIDTLRADEDGPARRLAALALGEIGAHSPATVPEDACTTLERTREETPADPDLQRAIDKALTRLRAGRPTV